MDIKINCWDNILKMNGGLSIELEMRNDYDVVSSQELFPEN
jgi:hypothetical protein